MSQKKAKKTNWVEIENTPSSPTLRKVAVISDLHGVLLDKRVYACFLELCKHEEFDEIYLNGDVADFPYLSRHDKQLCESPGSPLHQYSEIKEIEFIRRNILRPLREVTRARIVIRLGNHDERIVRPKRYSVDQLERVLELHHHYGTHLYRDMLDCRNIGIDYDPSPVTTLYGCFDIVHGLSLTVSAPLKNIAEYLSSGTTGHTHRLNSTFTTTRRDAFKWLESGCMRLRHQAEYLPTGKVPNWVNGFVTATFLLDDEKPTVHANTHEITDKGVVFHGRLYTGQSIGL